MKERVLANIGGTLRFLTSARQLQAAFPAVMPNRWLCVQKVGIARRLIL
jgi:hypothetical protein